MTVGEVLVLLVAVAILGVLIVVVRMLPRRAATPEPPVATPVDAGAVAAATEEARAEAAEIRRLASAEAEVARRTVEAEVIELRLQAEALHTQARATRDEVELEVRALREGVREQRLDIERREHRVAEREERLDAETRHLDDRSRELVEHEHEVARRETALRDVEAERRQILEQVAGLTASDAKAELMAAVETQSRREAALVVRDIERKAHAEGENRAREIVVGAIQRVASEQTAESVVSVLHLPSDEMKGRIIGREGRNIRSFEQVTGVNVIIDDTPEAVLLSCFDPVRREVGRLTLESLVLDGRIHPHRIEETYEKSKREVDALCQRAGEDAALEVGITDLHPELVSTLGRLRYRTSYGQNVLKHLVESAHLGGVMADELGLDRAMVRRCAFLHDIGKALTHEAEGSHAAVGAELARRHGEHEDVVHAIEAHHNEVEPRTVEAVLTQAADAISGGRPGARRESVEAYVTRLERLEQIALGHDGVEKVFAMQAGREVRVMVQPESVDDVAAQILAKEIAKQVEDELTYPGQIRITVVRESRASEYAR